MNGNDEMVLERTPLPLELTILIPCLNEAETISACVQEAASFLRRLDVSGEVLVSDNGSSDGSQQLALDAGARVITADRRGYGAALQSGIEHARGRYVIMGDGDQSYDFSRLELMLQALRAGNELVMGNRFKGGISPGAMPFLHKYLGNPVLSAIGRLFYRNDIGDFHCGLRGFRRDAILELALNSDGMEFASEMVVKSSMHGLRIAEVPTTLRKDGRSRPPHLRTWRDGWRHLKFLFLHSPRWLFLFPGIVLSALGAVLMLIIYSNLVVIGHIGLDIHTMAYAGVMLVVGFQMIMFSFLSTSIGIRNGWLPPASNRAMTQPSLEFLIACSLLLLLAGLGITASAFVDWARSGFGALDPRETMRLVVPSTTFLSLGSELFITAFLLEAIRLPARRKLLP